MQGYKEWVVLENMAMGMQIHQYFLAISNVVEVRVRYISAWEMKNQLVVLTTMMCQWSVCVSDKDPSLRDTEKHIQMITIIGFKFKHSIVLVILAILLL